MKDKNVMPTTHLLIAIVIMVALHLLFPVVRIIPTLWNLLGIIPLALGVVINLIADKAFHEANTTVKPFKESTTLITTGVFQVSRNPMYLGFVSILIGIGVLMGSLTPYVIILAFAIFMDRMYIRVEERMIAGKFGAEWEEYKRSTRKWL
ncbi:MAG: isoprenylcysteine carboxylmethyltransferase family protein [Chloroflexota bacterium]|nr:isoprenylcysteine carboxylmethyltransferase family protein [Chloroflexota bacterium]